MGKLWNLSVMKSPSTVVEWETACIMPDGLLPLTLAAASGPLGSPSYSYHPHWEGLRVLAGFAGPALTLRNAAGQQIEEYFPELTELRARVEPYWSVFDADLVVRSEGRVCPLTLQRRMASRTAEEALRGAQAHPAELIINDVLRIGDSWLLDLSWDARAEVLPRTLHPGGRLRMLSTLTGGPDLFTQARELELSRVQAKRRRARYQPGSHGRDWLSLRVPDRAAESRRASRAVPSTN